VALAGSTDHLPYSTHYGTVCKAVTSLVEGSGTTFRGIEHLAEEVAGLLLGPEVQADWVRVVIEKPRALLRADAAGIEITRSREGAEGEDKVFVNNLRLVTIIGVNPWEREERQNVVINLTLHKRPDKHYDFHAITNTVSEYVERSDYKTVEAFVTALAREACVTCGVEKVTVRAEKPSALTFAAAAGVEITREREFFALEGPQEGEKGGEGAQGRKHDVFIALGSNLGDRYRNISDAVVEMERRGIKVRRTSSLYQSAPMYVIDQPTFLNGVCQVPAPIPLLFSLADQMPPGRNYAVPRVPSGRAQKHRNASRPRKNDGKRATNRRSRHPPLRRPNHVHAHTHNPAHLDARARVRITAALRHRAEPGAPSDLDSV
jgi:dihydroneopterin aldolase/2-amino-4-hydroxy-6-hydroxymethyldihydropteridine diphosphokinase/dihydropteroate synthase